LRLGAAASCKQHQHAAVGERLAAASSQQRRFSSQFPVPSVLRD
jgi:hypothetical protein